MLFKSDRWYLYSVGDTAQEKSIKQTYHSGGGALRAIVQPTVVEQT